MPSVDTWLVLLRGINVGGNRVIPMADLRDAFAGMGFVDPTTYIQSGNVLVGSRRKKTPAAVRAIERGLSTAFGYDARVIVRDRGEMDAIVRRIPRAWDAADRSSRHNVVFLSDAVDPKDVAGWVTIDPAIESVSVGPHVVFWSAPLATITRSKMLKLSAHAAYPEMTIRNLRTALALHERMRERDAG